LLLKSQLSWHDIQEENIEVLKEIGVSGSKNNENQRLNFWWKGWISKKEGKQLKFKI
jgi:hypothetical protein